VALTVASISPLDLLHGIPSFDPGPHTAIDVVHMSVSQIGERFGGNVAAMPGLAIHHDVIVQLGPYLPMASFDFSKVDIQIRTWDDASRMFLR